MTGLGNKNPLPTVTGTVGRFHRWPLADLMGPIRRTRGLLSRVGFVHNAIVSLLDLSKAFLKWPFSL